MRAIPHCCHQKIRGQYLLRSNGLVCGELSALGGRIRAEHATRELSTGTVRCPVLINTYRRAQRSDGSRTQCAANDCSWRRRRLGADREVTERWPQVAGRPAAEWTVIGGVRLSGYLHLTIGNCVPVYTYVVYFLQMSQTCGLIYKWPF